MRVFREQGDSRTVVSHMAKHSRGQVARALLSAPELPRTPDDVVDASRAWFATHEVRTATGALVEVHVERAGTHLDVITRTAS